MGLSVAVTTGAAAALDSLNRIQGIPFGEIAWAHGLDVWAAGTHKKNAAGELIQVVLGKRARARLEGDLNFYNLEIRTLPLDASLRLREMTKVSMVDYADVYDQGWEESTVRRRLARILFVPVVKPRKEDPAAWFVRRPFAWRPSDEDDAAIGRDYEAIRSIIRSFAFSRLSSRPNPKGQGRILTTKTAGKDARDTSWFEVAGKRLRAQKRAFFLRREFTSNLVEGHVRYHAPKS